MKFEITWENGKKEVVEQNDCKTVEQFMNCRFGSAKTKAKVKLFSSKPVKETSIKEE